MSERVTWERCPSCGAPAAVGWHPTVPHGGEPAREDPVEFDCTSGCLVTVSEIVHAFSQRHPADQE